MNTIMANEGPDEDAGIARPEMLSGSNSTASLSTNVSTVLPKYHHNTHNSLELFAEAMGDICRWSRESSNGWMGGEVANGVGKGVMFGGGPCGGLKSSDGKNMQVPVYTCTTW